MEERVRTPGLVSLAATDDLESAVSVEPCGRDVLLIDINAGNTALIDRMSEKCAADSTVALGCIDEQHLQRSVEYSRESHLSTVTLCDCEGDSRKVVGLQPGLNLVSVHVGKKVVRRVHGASPDRSKCRILRRADRGPDIQGRTPGAYRGNMYASSHSHDSGLTRSSYVW